MKDFLGQDVKVGDRVVYITTSGGYPYWRVGTITEIKLRQIYRGYTKALRATIEPDKIESQKYCRKVFRAQKDFTKV